MRHIGSQEVGAAERVAGLNVIRLGKTQRFGIAELETLTERLARAD